MVAAGVKDEDPDWGDPLRYTLEDDRGIEPYDHRVKTSWVFVQPREYWFRPSVGARAASGVAVSMWVQLKGAQSAGNEQRSRGAFGA